MKYTVTISDEARARMHEAFKSLGWERETVKEEAR